MPASKKWIKIFLYIINVLIICFYLYILFFTIRRGIRIYTTKQSVLIPRFINISIIIESIVLVSSSLAGITLSIVSIIKQKWYLILVTILIAIGMTITEMMVYDNSQFIYYWLLEFHII